MKPFLVLIFVAAVLGCALMANAERVEISSAQELIDQFENEENALKTEVVLLDDLDFSQSGRTLPLGVSSNGTCIAFSGVLKANGHSIKNFVVGDTVDDKSKKAGLFCALKDATVENLVIDSSCSFTGYFAGGLSVSVNGSLIATNVRSKASVNGNTRTGGFVGSIDSAQGEMRFEGCAFEGNVIGKQDIGGFFGYFYGNENMTIIISNCTSNGTVTGAGLYLGGFIGSVFVSKNLTMIIDNCTNDGTVTAIRRDASGFIGCIATNERIALVLTNSVNNGNVSAQISSGSAAGFIADMFQFSEMNMTLSNLTNNGNITGTEYVGGLYGILRTRNSSALTVSNCVNNGVIYGTQSVGGFIGELNEINVKSFSNCTNNGKVIGTQHVGGFLGSISRSEGHSVVVSHFTNNGLTSGNNNVGGLVGYISIAEIFTMTISHCINNGEISGRYNLGGLFGAVNGCKDMNMEINNFTNNCNVIGDTESYNLGGFAGLFDGNRWVNITVTNSINNGVVTARYDKAGGFVGECKRCTFTNIVFSNSSNNGGITGTKRLGGFFGIISSEFVASNISVVIKNCANKGVVSANEEYGCGMFCVAEQYCSGINTTVLNSINKGHVDATTNGYGITNIITVARNVVSMGRVTGPSGSYTFWNASNDVHLFYGLQDQCMNCSDDATLFQHSDGFYEVVSTHERVHDLLNDEAMNQQFGMMWSSELDLVEPSSQSTLSVGIRHVASFVSIGVALVFTAYTTLMQ